MKRITILIPAYNEAESIPLLVSALDVVVRDMPQYTWEYLFVNDGSSDNTLKVLKDLCSTNHHVSYIDLSRNFGKENALLAGFDYATGDAVIIMDADLQHPPTIIPLMIDKWENGYDDVYAKRKTRGKESIIRKLLTSCYYRMLQGSSKMDVLPNVGDFRLLDKRCVEALRQMREAG